MVRRLVSAGGWRKRTGSGAFQAAQSGMHIARMRADVEAALKPTAWATPQSRAALAGRIAEPALRDRHLPVVLRAAIARAAAGMVAAEAEALSVPAGAPLTAIENVAQRARLQGFIAFISDPDRLTGDWEAMAADLLAAVTADLHLPSSSLTATAALSIPVPAIDLVTDPAQTVERIVAGLLAFHPSDLNDARPGAALARRIADALLRESGLTPEAARANPMRLRRPERSDHTGTALVGAYLGATPLADLLCTPVPLPVPAAIRSEHGHVLGSTGSGKTVLLQHLIAMDLPLVARGEASVVVLDSQGRLIDALKRIAVVPPERVVLIDPHDLDYPPSLNFFDVNRARIDRYSALDRERMTNSVISLLDFVMTALLSAELSSKQQVPFRYATRLLLQIPGATIHTFIDLMKPGATQRYAGHIARLPPIPRSFFATEFDGRQFNDTKSQVLRRLYGICENETFLRAFSHPRSKLDMFAEINAGRLILIDTAKDLLKTEGTEIFGRFFIALIAQAAQERAIIKDPIPCTVYVDECQDYIARDANITEILEQARKNLVGIVLCHQHLRGQISATVLDSIIANTSTKLAGNPSVDDIPALSRQLRCDPALLADRPKGTFVAHVRGVTPRGVLYRVPASPLARLSRRSNAELAVLIARVREKYAAPWSETIAPDAAPPPSDPEDFSDRY